MLTAAELGALLKPPLRAVVVERAESTNTSLMRMAATGAAEGTVLLALSQSAGRGQRGRTFYSPAGCGLYMSLLLRPRMRPEDALAVTPAAAVAAAQAIEAAAGWPAELEGKAGALFDRYPGDERAAALAADVLNRLWELCSLLPGRDFLDEYRSRSVLTGRRVAVSGRGEATVQGIDDDFRLLVRFDNGEAAAIASASELIW